MPVSHSSRDFSAAVTHYNYHRDYDPLAGSYVESDPLYGGSRSTYNYVRDNPVQLSDSTGQSVGAGVAVGIVVYSFGAVLCGQHLITKCAQHFPGHADPTSPDRAPFIKCVQAAVQACLMWNFAADPAGSVATEVGGKIGEALRDH